MLKAKENKKETIWGIRAKTTKKVFPKYFETIEMAKEFMARRADPEHWEIVKQEITYGEWKGEGE